MAIKAACLALLAVAGLCVLAPGRTLSLPARFSSPVCLSAQKAVRTTLGGRKVWRLVRVDFCHQVACRHAALLYSCAALAVAGLVARASSPWRAEHASTDSCTQILAALPAGGLGSVPLAGSGTDSRCEGPAPVGRTATVLGLVGRPGADAAVY